MKPRAARAKVSSIDARFGRHVLTLVELSASGALLATSAPVPVEGEWALLLESAGQRLPLKARVIRVRQKPGDPGGAGDIWLAGVAFVGLSATMQQAVARIVEQHLHPDSGADAPDPSVAWNSQAPLQKAV
jgi:hypothetical protein